jgi:hypothetical protein
MESLSTLDGARAWIERHRSVLSGSRARGDWHEDSDWDYKLAYRDVKILGRELRRQGIEFDSCITGHISWEPDGVRVEVYDCFPTRYDQRKGGLDGLRLQSATTQVPELSGHAGEC